MSSPTSEVVCDAGPLIHLDELGCLDMLADFSAVLVPDSVWQPEDAKRKVSDGMHPLSRDA
jgi:hypothetical protein